MVSESLRPEPHGEGMHPAAASPALRIPTKRPVILAEEDEVGARQNTATNKVICGQPDLDLPSLFMV